MNAYNGFSPAQREKAQRWLNAEWAAGRRPRPSRCCVCGQTEGIFDAHAEDYSEPFGDHTDAYTLCYRCHMMLHCRFRSPQAWEAYRAFLREGNTAAPLCTRSWGAITRQLAGTLPPFTAGPPRESLGLFDAL